MPAPHRKIPLCESKSPGAGFAYVCLCFVVKSLPVVLALTRMKHPHDPVTHSHHNSVWFSHQSVGDADFWSDNGGRIAHV